MELLARAGGDYHTKMQNDFNYSVLQADAARGAVRTVGFLLDRGVPMYHIHQEGDRVGHAHFNGTPLHAAATNGRCDVVRLLLGRGAVFDLETLDWRGRTPLLCASRGPFSQEVDAKRGSFEETIRLLVDAGADLTALDRRDLDWSPYLLDHEAFPDTPLGHVSAWGSGDIVRYLAGRGVDIHRRWSYPTAKSFRYVAGGDHVMPLHRAALNWNMDAVQALLDLGADPAASDEYGRQALHWAAMGKCVDEWWGRNHFSHVWGNVMVEPAQKTILSKRLNAMESTLTHLLGATNDPRGVQGRQDAFGNTPLHYAAYMKLVTAVVLFLEAEGGGGVNDVGEADNEGSTVLHHLVNAMYHHNPHNRGPVDGGLADERLVRALNTYIRDKQDVDIVDRTDEFGFTALHIAARAASYNAVALLLRLGADPNARVVKRGGGDDDDEDGSTALHLTIRCPVWVGLGTYEPEEYEPWKRQAARITELLLAAGANVGICDGRGRTAAQLGTAVDEELRRGRAQNSARLDRTAAEWARRRALDRGGLGRGWAGSRPVPFPSSSGAHQSPSGSRVGRGRGL
jgi:ankyrin repeat protein